MEKRDITGKVLPTLNVSGCHVLPPPYFILKTHMSDLNDFIRKITNGRPSKQESNRIIETVCELLSCNEENKKITFKRMNRQSLNNFFEVIICYIRFIQHDIPSLPRCAVPNVVYMENDDCYKYETYTYWEKLVAEYGNMPITEVYELNYVDYLILRREAFIYNLSQSEKGKDMLEAAYCLEQSEPDRNTLRANFGGGKK